MKRSSTDHTAELNALADEILNLEVSIPYTPQRRMLAQWGIEQVARAETLYRSITDINDQQSRFEAAGYWAHAELAAKELGRQKEALVSTEVLL